jgi:hypothetical protein
MTSNNASDQELFTFLSLNQSDASDEGFFSSLNVHQVHQMNQENTVFTQQELTMRQQEQEVVHHEDILQWLNVDYDEQNQFEQQSSEQVLTMEQMGEEEQEEEVVVMEEEEEVVVVVEEEAVVEEEDAVYTNEQDAEEKLKAVLEAMKEQFGHSTTVTIITKATKQLGLDTTPSRTQIRNSKFQKQISIPFLRSKLNLMKNLPNGFPATIPTPQSNSLQAYVDSFIQTHAIKENLDSTIAAATSARFSTYLHMAYVLQKAKQNDMEEAFANNIINKLSWSRNKYTRYVKRCNRIKELANITGRGGSAMFSFYISGNDVEDISQKDWQQYLRVIQDNPQLISFLKSITLLPNHTIPYV